LIRPQYEFDLIKVKLKGLLSLDPKENRLIMTLAKHFGEILGRTEAKTLP
jgi:hypothetical protein